MRMRLEEVEKKLKEYRRQYMGELPEQLDANLQVLERLQTQLSEREKSLREEKSRLIVVESQIEANRKILTESRPAVSEDGGALNLEQMKAQLSALKSTYTERHPDVVKLKARIAEMEAQYNSGELKSSAEDPRSESGDPAVRIISNSLEEAKRQRLEIRGEIQNIEIEIAKLRRQLIQYQERVERTPKREQELLSLKRDYENIKESYNSMLNRKLESEIALNMEKKQKGEQFRIVDYAALPQKPASPDMKKLLLLSIAGGFGLGAGLIFLSEYFNSALKHTKEYESELGLAVLAKIPRMYSPQDRLWIRVNRGLTVISIMIAVALTAGFAVLAVSDVDPTLELVKQFVKL
jgi:polysaccharide chain length determinant protein (PEP-CTERM system associated)